MAFVNRPTTRRKLANMIVGLANKLNEMGSAEGIQSGVVYYVNNVSGMNGVDDLAHGLTKALPFATIAYALTQCTAGNGDVVECAEGHAETLATASVDTLGCAMTKAGVTLRGVGKGSNRPTLSWATLSTATATITAAGCRMTNFIFDMSLPSALVSGIVISAAGCTIDNCLFKIGTAGAGTRPLQAILTTAAADYLTVEDCQFLEPSATPTTVSAASCAIKLVGGTGIRIRRNFFSGWYTLSIGAITSITTLNSHVQITENYIFNQTASSTKSIVLLTGSTGIIANNRMGILSGTAPVTGDAAVVSGNYYVAAAGAGPSVLI